MRIIPEEVDGHYYFDIFLTHEDVEKIKEHMLVGTTNVFKHRKYYLAIYREDGYGNENIPEGEFEE